jgi:hypothetical protein
VLNPRQEAFCLAYARTGNATASATEAGYSSKTAAVQAVALLRNPKVSERLAELTLEISSRKIADARERQEILSGILRGEGEAPVVTKDGVRLAAPAWPDRLKAIDLLNKMQGSYTEQGKSEDHGELDAIAEALREVPDEPLEVQPES